MTPFCCVFWGGSQERVREVEVTLEESRLVTAPSGAGNKIKHSIIIAQYVVLCK